MFISSRRREFLLGIYFFSFFYFFDVELSNRGRQIVANVTNVEKKKRKICYRTCALGTIFRKVIATRGVLTLYLVNLVPWRHSSSQGDRIPTQVFFFCPHTSLFIYFFPIFYISINFSLHFFWFSFFVLLYWSIYLFIYLLFKLQIGVLSQLNPVNGLKQD